VHIQDKPKHLEALLERVLRLLSVERQLNELLRRNNLALITRSDKQRAILEQLRREVARQRRMLDCLRREYYAPPYHRAAGGVATNPSEGGDGHE
jgi:hypothetical protein